MQLLEPRPTKARSSRGTAFAAHGAGVDVKSPHGLPPINAALRVDWGHSGPLDLKVTVFWIEPP